MIGSVKLASGLQNSLLVSLLNLLLVVVTFAAFIFPRFSNWGLGLVRLIVIGLIAVVCLAVRDLWRRGTRGRAVLALLLCLPALFLFGELTVWEGPLYINAEPATPLKFQVRGPAGFWGLKILRPDPKASEHGDDALEWAWTIEWINVRRFPPMQLEFSYGTPPPGYQGWTAPPPLDPHATYTLIVKPAMGTGMCYTLQGALIREYKHPYPAICDK